MQSGTHDNHMHPKTPTPRNSNAIQSASAIYAGFTGYRNEFKEITLRAKGLFESGSWGNVQMSGTKRLAIYKDYLAEATQAIRTRLGEGATDHKNWRTTKLAYAAQISGTPDLELAETFFNSVHRNITNDRDVSNDEMFVHSSAISPPTARAEDMYRTYRPNGDLLTMIHKILNDLGFSVSWQNIDRDIGSILRSMTESRQEILKSQDITIEILRSIFYRNKGAYAVGRLWQGTQQWPLALPILLDSEGRIYVDTLICDEDELSIVFSFTRSYFMVHAEYPSTLIDFVQALLPSKKRSELYASMGWHKHGKTEFYRGFLDHLEHSNDDFIIAPGVKGMVMSVFTLPSYQTAFKIVMDEFAPQKDITPDAVRDKYVVVKSHDRVGRMADTQEFSNVTFPRERFSKTLIHELLAVAPSKIALDPAHVVISHLYTERLMTPLNIYIESASTNELDEALDEYGNAIKQLAAANIFPGDMLLKNFGVTRHRRVVFYDYDEICYLTDVNFREIPEPRTPEEELRAEPWYTVAKNDVFPEEFRRFLFGRPEIKQRFALMHGELFDPHYWRQLQSAITEGQVSDVFPYRRKRRFIRQET